MKFAVFLLSIFTIVAHANPEKTVIDVHAHVACYGYQSDCYINPRVKDSYKFVYYQKLFNFTEKEAKKYGDSHLFYKINRMIKKSKYVKHVVILAMDNVYAEGGEAKPGITEFYVPNDFVAKNAQKYDGILFGASVHPFRKDALAELERVKSEGAVLVKLLPAIHHFHANDKRLIPYYKKLRELRLPLLIHMDDEHSFTSVIGDYGDPLKLELPLSLGVTVIGAHTSSLGKTKGQLNYERLLQMKAKYPNNLYADISALLVAQTRKGHLKRAVSDKRWHGGLLYGSDYPLVHPMLSSPYYYIFDIGLFKTIELIKIKNPWDRDIQLKKYLGAHESIFQRTAKVLNIE